MNRLAILILCLLASIAHARNPRGSVTGGSPFIGACPVTTGTITVAGITPRATGISPLLVFFDATGSTDSAALGGANNAFQDVTYTWTFGDAGASGTGKWAYGSNPGNNSKNTATGAIAAHLYLTSGADQPYTATVTATDGTSTAQCTVAVTAYDPAGASGFPGTATTCVAQLTLPVAGAGGCPAGAAVLTQASYATALSGTRANARTLFKCGDTFTGGDTTLSGAKWTVGAYGTCVGTQTGLPILNSSTSANGALIVSTQAGDGRITDIDFEGAGTGNAAVWEGGSVVYIPYQITLNNLYSNANKASYVYAQGAQWGLISLTQTSATGIGTFLNLAENNPCATSVTNACNGFGVTNTFNNIDYQALLGSNITGIDNTSNSSGIEAVRISACRLCVIENNSLQGANAVGAVLKIHNGNTYNSCAVGQPACFPGGTGTGSKCQSTGPTPTYASCWTGQYTELMEISDNVFSGHSGAQMVELAPQNISSDERMRNIVVERNFFIATTGATDGSFVLASSVNTTLRDNVFYIASTSAVPPAYGTQVCARPGTINGVLNPPPTAVEVYNNTMYAAADQSGMTMVNIASGGVCTGAAAANSFAQNNLFYTSFAGHSTVTNSGIGNTVSNNTATPTSNPAFTNGSTTFSLLTDFKPTANYSGAVSLASVRSDALGIAWSPTWDLGAVKH